METVLVIGAARSGIAVSKLLQKNGYHVILTDSNEVKEKMSEQEFDDFSDLEDEINDIEDDLNVIIDDLKD